MVLNLPKSLYRELKTLLALVYVSVGEEYFKKNFPSITSMFADDVFNKIKKE